MLLWCNLNCDGDGDQIARMPYLICNATALGYLALVKGTSQSAPPRKQVLGLGNSKDIISVPPDLKRNCDRAPLRRDICSQRDYFRAYQEIVVYAVLSCTLNVTGIANACNTTHVAPHHIIPSRATTSTPVAQSWQTAARRAATPRSPSR